MKINNLEYEIVYEIDGGRVFGLFGIYKTLDEARKALDVISGCDAKAHYSKASNVYVDYSICSRYEDGDGILNSELTKYRKEFKVYPDINRDAEIIYERV